MSLILSIGEGGDAPTKQKPPKTKWGKPALNFKTRAPYKPLGLILERRLRVALKNKNTFTEGQRRITKVY